MKLFNFRKNWELWLVLICIIIFTVVGICTAPAYARHKTGLDCMALNIYHEARNQSVAGQLAVGYVVMNRVTSKRYPNNICQVVKQPYQFSWYSDGKPDTPRERLAWKIAKNIAGYIMEYHRNDITFGATHYHASWLEHYPAWTKKLIRTIKIGDHIFYRRKL